MGGNYLKRSMLQRIAMDYYIMESMTAINCLMVNIEDEDLQSSLGFGDFCFLTRNAWRDLFLRPNENQKSPNIRDHIKKGLEIFKAAEGDRRVMNSVYEKATEKGIVKYMKDGGDWSSPVNDIFDEGYVEEASSTGTGGTGE